MRKGQKLLDVVNNIFEYQKFVDNAKQFFAFTVYALSKFSRK